MRSSSVLDAQVGRTIHIKDETVQRGGSFKFRGAILGTRNAERGVVAAGAGNFPIAVGLAARALGKPACLVMPSDAPAFKREQARETGAEIIITERSELTDYAQMEARKRGWRNLHAFEDIEMIAGSYTLGSEIAAAIQASSAASDAVVVACGGGGLAAGVALALRSRSVSGCDLCCRTGYPPTLCSRTRSRDARQDRSLRGYRVRCAALSPDWGARIRNPGTLERPGVRSWRRACARRKRAPSRDMRHPGRAEWGVSDGSSPGRCRRQRAFARVGRCLRRKRASR